MATTKRNKNDATVTVSQAAKQLRLAPNTVRQYCRRGVIGTEHVDPSGRRLYLLRPDEVAWLGNEENRPPVGRPRKAS